MSQRSRPQRIPVPIRPRSKHPSPSPRRRTPSSNQRSSKRSKPLRIPQRSKSEPNLLTVGILNESHAGSNFSLPGASLFRRRTYMDIFSSSDSLPGLPSPEKSMAGYGKETRVVVNVTVEGSPGPVRAMIKLGSSVEEAIRIVVHKYGEEGRSPLLDHHAASTFELHQSYFSLEGLSKSEVIGDVGSRSFYLRKGSGDGGGGVGGASCSSEIVLVSPPSPRPLFFFLPGNTGRSFRKLVRRMCKVWKILGCLHCN